ncbi:hypothetical protein [Paracoccus aeridis]|nr:hypothetical protein [Paracoccus aeridis]
MIETGKIARTAREDAASIAGCRYHRRQDREKEFGAAGVDVM